MRLLKTATSWSRTGLILTLITFILLELGVYLLATNGLINIPLPNHRLGNIAPFWVNNKEKSWGTWHAPNREYHHRKSCFDVVYRTNAFGMRDRPRQQLDAAERVVVLGDSFVEGWGVNRDDRFTDQLEQATDIAHLNFGTSGSFGPTQYLTIYRDFARRFSHDAVIIAILPDNDFEDDSLQHGKRKHKDQYRPYLAGDYPDYQIVYYNESVLANRAELWIRYAEGLAREYSHVVRAFDYLEGVRKHQIAKKRAENAMQVTSVPSPYFDYTEEQWLRLKFAIERITALAGEREVLVTAIPRFRDFLRANLESDNPPLTDDLSNLANEKGFVYLDLLSGMKGLTSDWRDYFHSCDGHWSEHGHAVAAELLAAWSYYDPT